MMSLMTLSRGSPIFAHGHCLILTWFINLMLIAAAAVVGDGRTGDDDKDAAAIQQQLPQCSPPFKRHSKSIITLHKNDYDCHQLFSFCCNKLKF